MTALRTLLSLAWVVAPALVGWAASRFPAFGAFGVFGAAASAQIVLLLVFSSLFLIPQTSAGRDGARPVKKLARSELQFGRIVGIIGVSLLRTALFLHAMAIPLVLTSNLQGTLADVGLNAALCAGLEIPFMLAWGYAATRFSQEAIVVFNALLYALYLSLVYSAKSVEVVLWLQGLNAIATSALVSIPLLYMQESIKGRVGLSTALIDVARVVAELTAAVAFALFVGSGDFNPALLAAACISLLGGMAVGVSKVVPRASRSPSAERN